MVTEEARSLATSLTKQGMPVVAQSVRDLAQQVEDLQAKNERMKDFIEYTEQCPCCTEKEACNDGCTFEHDCPQDYETMQQARKAMK